MNILESLMLNLAQWEWLGILLARISVGLLFVLSGYGKVFVAEKREQMKETMESAGVPLPQFNAVFVSWVELIFGVALLIGFLTPLASLMLAATMIVAILTVKLKGIEGGSLSAWLSEFLFLPEVLYLVILIWLFFSGPGIASVDWLLLAG